MMRYRNAWIVVGSTDAGFVTGRTLRVRGGTSIASIVS
jgi:hypothetical protein